MTSKPKRQAVLSDADELVEGGLFDGTSALGFPPQLVESQRVKFIGVGKYLRVGVHGDRRDFDDGVCRNVLAIRERERLQNFALEGSFRMSIMMRPSSLSGRSSPIVAGCSRSVSLRQLSIFFIACRALLLKELRFSSKASWISSRRVVASSGRAATS